MNDADGYFGEPVAATYDESESAEFEPGLVETTVGRHPGDELELGRDHRR